MRISTAQCMPKSSLDLMKSYLSLRVKGEHKPEYLSITNKDQDGSVDFAAYSTRAHFERAMEIVLQKSDIRLGLR